MMKREKIRERMRKRTWRAVSLLAVIFWGIAFSGYAETAGDLSQTKDEIYGAWINYLNAFGPLSGKIEYQSSTSEGDHQESVRKFLFSYPYEMIDTLEGEEGYVTRSKIQNGKYVFEINNDSNSSNLLSTEKIDHLEDPQKRTWFNNERFINKVSDNPFCNDFLNVMGNPLHFFPLWLPPMIKNERLIIESLENRTEDGRSVAVLKFTTDDLVTEDRLIQPLRGELTLLPDHYWLPLKGECFLMWDEEECKVTIENHFDFDSDVPLLTEQNRKTWGDITVDSLLKISDIKRDVSINPKDFTFSHFGFPDPDRNSRRYRTVMMVVDCAVILFVIFIIYRKKRRSHVFRNREE